MINKDFVNVYGAGLAGVEAAYKLAQSGIKVNLYEMKPQKYSPAHHYQGFAELVCSNSLRSAQITNAVGLLKEEMRRLDSVVMKSADNNSVSAGSALAVDRELFSNYITDLINSHPNITVISREVTEIDKDHITVIATGPLTSERMSKTIANKLGTEYLSFFDAAAPIVDAQTINMNKAFFASRWGKGDSDYLNCPFTAEEYKAFYNELVSAREAELKDFDREIQGDLTVFEGCMPVEVMARRGEDTLRFGPLKPVGLPLPGTGEDAYAVVQLRKENTSGTMYNLVGFQTHLTWGEQKRVFRMIPGLENAEFLRYGVMHRNTYINSPKLMTPYYNLRDDNHVFFAGQMTGVEGYVESAASGIIAGLNAARMYYDKDLVVPSADTVIGSMAAYISNPANTSFQPMNANFGLVNPLGYKVKGGKQAKNELLAARALEEIDQFTKNYNV